MKFKAEINIMPHKELLDPQGKTVGKNMGNIGITGIENIRIGKHIELELDADDKNQAEEKIETACKKLLSNVVMEYFTYSLEPIS